MEQSSKYSDDKKSEVITGTKRKRHKRYFKIDITTKAIGSQYDITNKSKLLNGSK
jgi:hypothetical protein